MVAKWMGATAIVLVIGDDHVLGLGLPIAAAGAMAIMDERREGVHTHKTGQMVIGTSAGE